MGPATTRSVMFLSVSDQLGGSEIVLLQMIAGIRQLRPSWNVHLVLPGRGPLLGRAEELGADCVILPLPRSLARLGEFAVASSARPLQDSVRLALRLGQVALVLPGYIRRLRRAVDSGRPAILHTNGVKAHVLGALLKPQAKLVWHLHEYVGSRSVTRALLRRHQHRAASIVANSTSVARDAEAALGARISPQVIHNAVDLNSFTPEGSLEDLDARAGLPSPAAPVVRIGLIGTFARWKGHEIFLRALASLPDRPAVRGYVIGEPVYATAGSQYSLAELRGMASSLGLGDRVGFTGFLRPAPAIRALDIVVHASTQPEPFGLVIAEGMACGRAVVTSAAGGAAELIRPGVDALTHTPGDPVDLAAKLRELAGNSALRRELGQRARAAACERFSPDRLARELVTLYERVA